MEVVLRARVAQKSWSTADMPLLRGKLAVVTGASGGLGLEVASALAGKGAELVVAARNAEKGARAVSMLGGAARIELLDLADLGSVAAFSERLRERGQPIDLLVNNAGLAAPRKRLTTRNGFELQFGTNFLGHFALTGLLLPLLRAARGSRVVTVSSLVERSARLDLGDLMSERRYSPTRSYGQSKLANLIFARELERRARAGAWGLMSVAAHPGIARTELTKPRPGQPVIRANILAEIFLPMIGHGAAEGALPILFAATDLGAEPGGYYGPTGSFEIRGPPGPARSGRVSLDPLVAGKLWEVAEDLTGHPFQSATVI